MIAMLAGLTPAASCAEQHAPLSVAFLLDNSGSMKDNDQHDVRIAAAQSLAAMMPETAEVAIIEFGSTAEVRLIGGRSQWASVKEKSAIYETLQSIRKDSQFTDFRAALEASAKVFASVDPKRRRILLLLTDGILDPNPEDPVYAPHHLSYKMDMIRAGHTGRKRILDEYRERLSPIARRLIDSQSIPSLRAGNIEVFSVGLGASADGMFLQDLSQQTSKRPEELHTFQAAQATDLMATFSQLLLYWTDLEVLHKDGGLAGPDTRRSIYLDEFVQNAKLVILTDSTAEPFIQSTSGAEPAESGTHKSLHLFPMTRTGTPAAWEFGFRAGTGQFRSLVVGTSGLQLDVSGIRNQYRFGEQVQASAKLRLNTSTKSEKLPKAAVHAEIQPIAGGSSQTVDFLFDADKYSLAWQPQRSGAYTLRVTAQLESPTRQEVLPRRGLVYQFEVLQNLYIEPTSVQFGTIEKGSSPSREVRVHSGLAETIEMSVSSRIKSSSSAAFKSNETARMPQIAPQKFLVQPGSTVPFSIKPLATGNFAWGDYEGEVVFSAAGRAPIAIQFSLHVPSIWEKLRWWILALAALLLTLICYLVWVLGWLRAPSGTLVHIGNCPGIIPQPIRLSQIRRGVFIRWLNWNRNKIKLSEMKVADRPAGLDIEFVFQTWGAVYTRNISAAVTFEVKELGGGRIPVKPGRSLRLTNSAVLTIGSCSYRYDAS